MKIYISGKITGTTDYMERFAKAEKFLKRKYPNASIINPAKVNANLPADTTWEQYMDMSLTMLKMCDTIYMLKGYSSSRGAKYELKFANVYGLRIFLED